MKTWHRVIAAAVLLVASLSPLAAQADSRFYKAYDDVRFKIWYMNWRRGDAPVAPYRHDGAAIAVFLADGTLRQPSGAMESHKAGEVVSFGPGSVANGGELVTNNPLRAVIVELKDLPPSLPPALAGFPPAFPRANATIMLENAGMVVWDVWYRPEQPLPMTLYMKNTVQVWLTDAVVERTHMNQSPQRDVRRRGDWEATHAGFASTEHVSGAPAHVIAIEHK